MIEPLWGDADLIPIIDDCPDLVSVFSWTGEIVYMNPAAISFLGFTDLAHAQGHTIADVATIGPHGPPTAIEGLLRNTGVWRGNATLTHVTTAQTFQVSAAIFVLDRKSHRPHRIAAIARDPRSDTGPDNILRDALAAAARRTQEYRALADLSRLAIQGDMRAVVKAATEAAMSLMSVTVTAIFRETPDPSILVAINVTSSEGYPATVSSGNTSMAGYAFTNNVPTICSDVDTETRFSVDWLKRFGLRAGAAVPIQGPIHPWGVLTLHCAVHRDFTAEDISFLTAISSVLAATIKRISLEDALRRSSFRDPLTGLPNRLQAFAKMRSAAGQPGFTAVMLIDLDDFKRVNDNHGHSVGDAALKALAARLSSVARPTDLVARLGGDEFIVVCPDIGSPAEAMTSAERLVDAITEPIVADGFRLTFTASIGVALTDGFAAGEELVRRADLAMYRSKSIGPGGCALYDVSDDVHVQRRTQLSSDLAAALDSSNRLTTVYTAEFDLRTGLVHSVIAEAVWDHPTLGIVEPGELVATADASQLMHELDTWIFDHACADVMEWRKLWDIRLDFPLLSAGISQPGLTARAQDACMRVGLPIDALGIIIPRSEWARASDEVRQNVAELREAGAWVTVGNTGDGRGSLPNVVSSLEVDGFVLDRINVVNLPGTQGLALCRAMIALAHATDNAVTASEIANLDQLDALVSCECDYGRGNFLAPRCTADEFERILQTEAVPNAVRGLDTSDVALRVLPQPRQWLADLDVHCVYQPVVDLATRSVVGYEALARGPAGTPYQTPDRLFDIARRLSVVPEVDWMCRLAAIRGAEEGGLPPSIPLYINCEPAALSPSHSPPKGARSLIDAGRQRSIVMEVTERKLTVDPAGLLAAAEHVRQRGWRVAVDDVGANRESLALLPFLHPEIIKLDISLVTKNTNHDTAEVVTAVTAESQRTGAVILAEGIETEEQAALAVSMGATLGQGYLFGRGEPLPSFAVPFEKPDSAVVLPTTTPIGRGVALATTPYELLGRSQARSSKRPLIQAICEQLERQVLGMGNSAVVLATFEHGHSFGSSAARRFATLASNSSFVAVFGVDMPPTPATGVRGVALEEDDPLANEWSVVVVGPHFSGALISVDMGADVNGGEHRFEYKVTYDRTTVVAAAEILMRRIPQLPDQA